MTHHNATGIGMWRDSGTSASAVLVSLSSHVHWVGSANALGLGFSAGKVVYLLLMSFDVQGDVEDWIASGELTVDLAARRASFRGRSVVLTAKECNVLVDMLSNPEPDEIMRD